MSSVPVASSAPVVSVSTAVGTKAASSSSVEQPFGNVLAREMNRQDGTVQAGKKPAQGAAGTTPKNDASEEEVPEDAAQAQASAASPWLLMLQQQAAAPVLVPVQAEGQGASLTDQDATTLAGQDATMSALNPLLAQEAVLPVLKGSQGDGKADSALPDLLKGKSQTTLSVDGLASGKVELQDETALPTLLQQAANVSIGAGKDLPQSGQLSSVVAFADELAGKLGATDDTQAKQMASTAFSANKVVEYTPANGQAESVRHVVSEPVGDTRWGDAVAQRVSLMLGRNEQQMEMQLNPPHLGPMEVRLTLGSDQASVVFTSQQASVREALAAATPRLTALLADQGIQLVNVQVASDSLNQQAQEQARQQAASSGQGSGRRDVPQYGLDVVTEARVPSSLRIPVARSGVSLYV